ncbi:FtsQ-type POTRA domain-containing protein [Clostridioides sp. ZZV13-5731]|uniref:cell division protein FtsQ/DivIB n=1 Tax=unclassified Clostridioides TaxID=2635829 RepID=UPI001D10A60E|nr:FtsQ-type POTRA domain-containing protein [Clostridioides sp. ZZV14-6150]MCC0667174.1 FtsQ-type POTRA domain-containing protein [Clostridioides sp. ZZV14-6153]MCC0749156.1 FtsQ-type POTRA domain-containing protein [Clostridioides sp. ZZV13-5731]
MKRRKKLNTNNVMIVLVFILMLSFGICIIVGSDLFDVKRIDVIGNKRVTKSNIMKELNVSSHENIFEYNFKDMKSKLMKNPYIEDVEIKRKLPNKIIISLKEKEIFAALKDEDNYCYIDKKGNLLEELKGTNESKNDLIVEVDYNIDDTKSIKFKNYKTKENVFKTLNYLKEEGIYRKINYVNFKKEGNVDMLTRSNIKILLSNDDNLDYNISRVNKILIDLQNKNTNGGTINLNYGKLAVYTPEG